ncbi:MAG: hypothetical protein ACU83U_16185, partial [Gammaproteobacteria bacterium]
DTIYFDIKRIDSGIQGVAKFCNKYQVRNPAWIIKFGHWDKEACVGIKKQPGNFYDTDKLLRLTAIF